MPAPTRLLPTDPADRTDDRAADGVGGPPRRPCRSLRADRTHRGCGQLRRAGSRHPQGPGLAARGHQGGPGRDRGERGRRRRGRLGLAGRPGSSWRGRTPHERARDRRQRLDGRRTVRRGPGGRALLPGQHPGRRLRRRRHLRRRGRGRAGAQHRPGRRPRRRGRPDAVAGHRAVRGPQRRRRPGRHRRPALHPGALRRDRHQRRPADGGDRGGGGLRCPPRRGVPGAWIRGRAGHGGHRGGGTWVGRRGRQRRPDRDVRRAGCPPGAAGAGRAGRPGGGHRGAGHRDGDPALRHRRRRRLVLRSGPQGRGSTGAHGRTGRGAHPAPAGARHRADAGGRAGGRRPARSRLGPRPGSARGPDRRGPPGALGRDHRPR